MIFSEIRDIIRKKDLLRYLVLSELRVLYKNKAFGFLWAVLDPFFLMLVYLFLIKFVFNRGGEYYPVLLFISLLSFRWVSTSLSTSVKTLASNAKLIQSINFPKSILPLSRVLISFVNFLAGLIILFPLMYYFGIEFSIQWFWLPVIVLIQFIFTSSVSLIIGVAGLYFRDLQNILIFILRMWVYLSPVLYNLEDVPEEYNTLYQLVNPLASLFASYKNILVRATTPSPYLIYIFFLSIVLGAIGLAIFRKKNNDFVKNL